MTASHCPSCGYCLASGSGPERDPIADLRAWCERHGHHVLPGDRVDEGTAAKMLDRSPGTLRNWAAGTQPLAFAVNRGRRRYALIDIARFLDGGP